MATPEQINTFIDNLYLAAGNDPQRVAAFAWTGLLTTEMTAVAFENNPELYGAFINRAKLETDVAALQSQIRVVSNLGATQQADIAQQLGALQTALAAKMAEIDALGA